MTIAVLLCVAFEARAGDTPEERANALYTEGKDLMTQGELAQAAAKFTEAWETFKHPLIMKKRAECREKLIEFEEAIEDYRLYLTKIQARDKNERRLILERVSALEALLTKPVTVGVSSTRPNVLVGVDGGPGKPTPFEIELVPGRHRIEVKDTRFQPSSTDVRVQAGKSQLVKVDVVPRTGRVVLATDRSSFEGTQLALDSQPLKLVESERLAARTEPRELVVGEHALVCTIPGRPSFYTTFEVSEGGDALVTCRLGSRSGTRFGPWPWVAAGSGAAGLAAGIGLFVSWSMDVKKAEDTNQDLITNKHIIGGVLLGVGAALGVATGLLFWKNAPDVGEAEHAHPPVFVVVPHEDGVLGSATLRF